jgi:hypothetical protein
MVEKKPQNVDIHERAFSFACAVVALNDVLAERGASAAQIGRELLRAGASLGAQLERADTKAALQDAEEALYWLRLLKRTGKTKAKDLADSLIHEAERLVSLLGGFKRGTAKRT